jgi:hypothetical protein
MLERVISFMLLVLPGTAGVVFGTLIMTKNEPRKWITIAGVFLNGAFALFMALCCHLLGERSGKFFLQYFQDLIRLLGNIDGYHILGDGDLICHSPGTAYHERGAVLQETIFHIRP